MKPLGLKVDMLKYDGRRREENRDFRINLKIKTNDCDGDDSCDACRK